LLIGEDLDSTYDPLDRPEYTSNRRTRRYDISKPEWEPESAMEPSSLPAPVLSPTRSDASTQVGPSSLTHSEQAHVIEDNECTFCSACSQKYSLKDSLMIRLNEVNRTYLNKLSLSAPE